MPNPAADHRTMALVGAHVLLYTSKPEDVRAIFRIVGRPRNEGWGISVEMALPGGLRVMLYEPHHAMAIAPRRSRRLSRSRGGTHG